MFAFHLIVSISFGGSSGSEESDQILALLQELFMLK